MPDINLTTLKAIPNIDLVAMIQSEKNKCGAYSLVAAVGAHGVFPTDKLLKYRVYSPVEINNSSEILLTDNFTELSKSVYKITGILNNGSRESISSELLLNGKGYNSPAAMAKVIIDLGMDTPCINIQEVGFLSLKSLYPGEMTRCINVVGKENINTSAGLYSKPKEDETHLVCVSSEQGGLNWVAQGSNGCFYDPTDGSISNMWEPKEAGSSMGRYIFTGLWVVIS